jgi:ribosomal protein L37AE/L43A
MTADDPEYTEHTCALCGKRIRHDEHHGLWKTTNKIDDGIWLCGSCLEQMPGDDKAKGMI